MPSKAQVIHLFSGRILTSTRLENILTGVIAALFWVIPWNGFVGGMENHESLRQQI